MNEQGKLIGGLLWVVGAVLLAVGNMLGVVVLLVALLMSVRSVRLTRERRHRERAR